MRAIEHSDIVALNGGSFIARHDDPGECPGSGWQSLTLPGKRGERGPHGERGPAGSAINQVAARSQDRVCDSDNGRCVGMYELARHF